MDASLIPAPRQHLSEDEKAAIKEGQTADEIWTDEPGKAAQKDTQARPDTIPIFGYKNHIGIDRENGLIRTWLVTDAAAHDGVRLREGLIDQDNTASDV